MKKIALTAALAALPFIASAQNVARTELTNAGLVNFEAGLINAPSTTLTFANDGATYLLVRSALGSAANVRFVTQANEINVGGFGRVSISDVVVSVPANGRVVLGPFPTTRWNDGAGLVNAVISSTASISVTAVRGAQ